MAVIAFTSAKGSPGVTTTLAALAATWPRGRRLLVAELDPAGGELAIWFDLHPEPGLVSLAAAGRRELEPGVILAHTQMLPSAASDHHPEEHRRLLAGPVAAEQSHAALYALRGRLAPALVNLDNADVLVDCGRMDPGSPALEVFEHADLVVAVTRPDVTAVHHLGARLKSVNPPVVSVLTVGDQPYTPREVAAAVDAEALGALPVDAKSAKALAGSHPDALRALRRSSLLRTARTLAEGLVRWLEPEVLTILAEPPPPEPAPPPPAPTEAYPGGWPPPAPATGYAPPPGHPAWPPPVQAGDQPWPEPVPYAAHAPGAPAASLPPGWTQDSLAQQRAIVDNGGDAPLAPPGSDAAMTPLPPAPPPGQPPPPDDGDYRGEQAGEPVEEPPRWP
ncbi:MAG: hypothetical protein ACRD29_10660 [Acidimicrobiales bacterium]